MVNNEFIIPTIKYTQRETTIVNILKENQDLKLESFMNVGFHDWQQEGRHWWIKICEANNIDWKILEIYEPNVKNALDGGCPPEKIILGSIMDVDKYPNVDCMFFWHGPEHIKKQEYIDRLPEIEKKVNKLVIFGMPLGHEPQGAAYGNPHEVHVSDWYPKDWEELGYSVVEVHDRKPAHITVYKRFG